MLKLQNLMTVLCVFWIAVTATFATISGQTHHVSIQLNGKLHLCSGSIINQHHILTARTCIDGAIPENLNVIAGSGRLNSGGVSYEIAKIITPEESNITSNIALLRTQQPIEFSENVFKVKIASKSRIYNGDEVTLTAWVSPESDENSNYLQRFYFYFLNGHYHAKTFGPEFFKTLTDPKLLEKVLMEIDFGGAILDRHGIQVGISLESNHESVKQHFIWHTAVYKHAEWIKKNSDITSLLDVKPSGSDESVDRTKYKTIGHLSKPYQRKNVMYLPRSESHSE